VIAEALPTGRGCGDYYVASATEGVYRLDLMAVEKLDAGRVQTVRQSGVKRPVQTTRAGVPRRDIFGMYDLTFVGPKPPKVAKKGGDVHEREAFS
jgi:hypothetical protein